jgi:SPP1 gp7 family putative phage head morphogenesis protein
MATANEMFRDSLLRRQILLAHLERGTQEDLMALLDATERDLRIALQDRLGSLAGKEFTKTVNSRLNVLTNVVSKIRSDAFDEVGSMWDDRMKQLAVDEAGYLDENFKDVMPVVVDTVVPAGELLRGLVDATPVRGRVLSDWASTAADADVQRIMDGVRIGMLQGDSADDIVHRILGSKELDGTDGVLEMARRDVATITQTAISTIANEARSVYFQENSDVFAKEQFVATLDDATCEECGALDGEEFPIGEGEQPPIHFNCRCVRVPVIDDAGLGSRPANAAFEDELDGLSKADRADRISELVGQVPGTTRYSDWLASQSQKFQDHVLGPNRAALFRDGGLTLDKFVNRDGKTLNLDQLRELNPGAFRRAGI